MEKFLERLARAARLDPSLYEEVEADVSATSQAAIVVVLSSIAAGIGSTFGFGVSGLVLATVTALVGWGVWAVIIYVVGSKLLPEPTTKTDLGEILRVLGFASAPGLIRVVGVVDALAGLAMFVAAVWMIAAMVVGVRQALDYSSTGRAVAVCIVGFLVQLLVSLALLAPMAAAS
jgi:phage shock protein PspC (stress-responsive transcriptional regulator)